MKNANYPILSVNEIAPGTYDVVIDAPDIADKAIPGQFLHIACGDGVLLRRPISICNVEGNTVRFVFYVKGEGTKYLATKKAGDCLDVLGPLGKGFHAEKSGEGVAILIGGGIGIFPLFNLAKNISGNTEIILGFRTKDLVIMEEEFASVCDNLNITTDDGTYGTKGLVTDELRRLIAEKNVTSIYSCGPMPMMKAIKNIALEHNIYCELSLEERMGCGFGACSVCVCKSQGEYKKVCYDGPVFDAREVDFDD